MPFHGFLDRWQLEGSALELRFSGAFEDEARAAVLYVTVEAPTDVDTLEVRLSKIEPYATEVMVQDPAATTVALCHPSYPLADVESPGQNDQSGPGAYRDAEGAVLRLTEQCPSTPGGHEQPVLFTPSAPDSGPFGMALSCLGSLVSDHHALQLQPAQELR